MKLPDACEQALGADLARLYGELPPERAKALDAHLQACPNCCRQTALRREAAGLLDLWEVPAVPLPGHAGAVPERRARRTRAARLRPVAAGFLVAALLFSGLFLVGTTVTRTSGGLVITFGTPEPEIVLGDMPGPSSLAQEICDRRFSELKEDLGLVFERWQSVEEERRAQLLWSVVTRLKDERVRTDLALEALHRITFDESQALGGALRILAQTPERNPLRGDNK